MLDFDLAALYEVETRVLNQAVKRNIKRFPSDFMFQLTKEEFENLRFQIEASQQTMSSQIVMTYPSKRPKAALPYAFAEQGVAMLSGVKLPFKSFETTADSFKALTWYRFHFLKLHFSIP